MNKYQYLDKVLNIFHLLGNIYCKMAAEKIDCQLELDDYLNHFTPAS